MKHRRSLDFKAPFPPAHFEECDGRGYQTLKCLSEWQVLGARCGHCGRVAWLDKRAIEREIGNQYLMHLPRKLSCTCGNRDGNRILIGTLPR